MSTSINNYSIIWKHFKSDSASGIHLKAPRHFSLPYFVDGKDKQLFEKKMPIELNVLHLIKGLLVGYFDQPPGVDTSFAQQKAKDILTEHLETFSSSSLENLILDFSAHLRKINGNEASLQALIAGIEIAPESNSIKYDCCVDLYNFVENSYEEAERKKGINRLTLLLNEIDESALDADLRSDLTLMKRNVQTL